MKRILAVLIYLLGVNSVFSQNYNWITPNQVYLKMYVVNDGMYRIDKNDFVNAGISVASIDPRTVKVYYKGNQTPIYFYGESDGVFDDADYFDFYGIRNYGGLTNTYDISGNIAYTTNEYYNLYSDTSVYWIGWGGAQGLRFADYNNSSSVHYSLDYYYQKLHFEKEQYYSLGQNTGTLDNENFLNDKYKGEGWYWTYLANNNSISQPFTVNLPSNTPQQCRLKLFAYPYSQNPNIFNEHRLVIKINSTQFDTVRFDNLNRLDTTLYFSGSALTSGANSFLVRYLPITTSLLIWFDYFELTVAKRFEFESNYISIPSELTDNSPMIFYVKGVVPSNPVSIYDTKNGNRIINYSISNDTLFFVGKGNGNYEINNKQITNKPFRIKQRQVPPLVTNSTGTDYLIVYNKLFESQAEQLRAYRNTHDGFRTFKAEIEDLYDIFNYGMESPVAVRNFTKNVYETWTLPKFKYLCLFGRGSVDPKKYLTTSVYYQNFVPVYGNPITDGYFANFKIGTFTFSHQVAVGRLPAYTPQEAQDMVNKIIYYESQPLQSWIKKPVFITGGYDRNEQQSFAAQSNYFINSYISPAPLASDPVKIFLNDTSGAIVFNYPDSIIKSINRGALIVNFVAHAGQGFWNNAFEDPGALSNDKYPLVYSMTCLSGKCAEPDARGFGERFAYYPGKGSIGFFGTSGWSFSGTGGVYNDYLLQALALDTLRRTGDILKYASVTLGVDTTDFAKSNTINCYGLLGDPALKLLLPVHPEFDIQNQDYNLSDENPPARKNITFSVFPKNLGLYADSCKIRFQILKRNIPNKTKDTIVHGFRFIDTLRYYLSFDTAGDYSLKISIDPDNWYPSDNKSNNILTVSLTVKNYSFVPLKPENNQSVYRDTVEFVGINPNVDIRRNSLKLMLQMDTTANFNSSVQQNYLIPNIVGVKTKIKVHLPLTDTNVVYFWRLNSIMNNADTLGWSLVRRFTYHSNGTPNDSLIVINKYLKNQSQDFEISNLTAVNNNYALSNYIGKVLSSSFSNNMTNPSFMILNKYLKYYISDADVSGLLIAKVTKFTGSVIDFRHISFTSSTSSDSLINYLSTFDTTNILVLLKQVPVGTSSELNSSAKAVLRQFGSVSCDAVSLMDWGRWSFISYRSLPNKLVSESYFPDLNPWVPATCSMDPAFMFPAGSMTNIIGPAQSWQNFNWNQVLNPYTNIKFDVIGIQHNNNETMLMNDVTTNNLVNLQGINALQYPQLKLIAKVSIDTINGVLSPLYKGLNLKYVGPPEIALDNNSIYKSDSIVTMGDSVGIGGMYYNIGYVPLNSHIRNFYALDGAGNKVMLKSDTIFTQLKVDSSMFVKASFKVNRLPIYKKYLNQIAIVLEIQPLNQNDIYDYNNSVISSFYVKGSLADFQTEVYSDGTRLYGNDYVRSTPDMLIKLTGKSIEELLSSDTSLFRVMLNNQFVSLYGYSKSQMITTVAKETDKGNFVIKFTPRLKNGLNYLNLISEKGSGYDTAKFVLDVVNETSFRDVYNYPNPMKDNTLFTFNLTGNQMPGECRIKIFSVAGRVIKEIVAPANVGFNQVQWDGRDADGDYIANGVYFYRLLIKGDSEKHSEIQKLVVLR
ncbi:MAG: C25 family cysteine peptidase [Ignavibacteria bacterium]|nr:C25 family cysteine peptidase [Ignavibacteria bacterium]